MYMLLAVLVGGGGLLAVYVPLIPFIIFSFGAVGWVISCVEAMVAGPIVALGIISPTQHGHEFLGKAEHALMLIFNIFLRPSLMIFGLVAAMYLSNVLVAFVSTFFFQAVIIGMGGGLLAGAGGVAIGGAVAVAGGPVVLAGGAAGGILLLFLFIFLAYVYIVLTVLNKCFATIYIIPEQVMRWIGGKGEQYGEEAAAGEIKRGTEAGIGKMGGAMAGAETQIGAGFRGQKNLSDAKKGGDSGANIKGE
jgi:defect-in-organelle-trafficking protein DotA